MLVLATFSYFLLALSHQPLANGFAHCLVPSLFISVLLASILKIGNSSPILPPNAYIFWFNEGRKEVKEDTGKVELDSGMCSVVTWDCFPASTCGNKAFARILNIGFISKPKESQEQIPLGPGEWGGLISSRKRQTSCSVHKARFCWKATWFLMFLEVTRHGG